MAALKATRYCDASTADLEPFIENELPFLDFTEVRRFYEIFWESDPTDNQIALLGANDRFFLLTETLNRRDAIHPWLYDRCREVEAEPFGCIDLWARYHFKSTIITFAGSIQGIIQDPEITICIFSGVNKVAKPFLRQIKEELEKNDKLKALYPDVFWEEPAKQSTCWSMSDGICVKRKGNPKEQTVEAYGLIDGMPTGRHFRRLVYDDLITEKHVSNPEMVAKVTERWELSDNLGCGEGTEVQTIGTRYSFGDTYGIILERNVAKPRIYQATDNGKLDGNPVFVSPEFWEKIKNKQRSTVSAQMLQNPMAGKENTFRPEWLRRFEVRPHYVSVYIMVDPSGGKTRKSDRTAIAVIAVDANHNKFLVDGFRHRMSLSERWFALKMLHAKWSNERGVTHIAVGYEKYGMQSDIEYFTERMQNENYQFEINELNWPNEGPHAKKARIERLEPDVRLGRFYFPALVYQPGKGDCFWHVDEATSAIMRPLARGPTSAMKKMADIGMDHLICRSIRRRDEDGKPYDVSMALMEEMLFHPFAPHDDLVDVASRIYDMSIIVPSAFEDKEAEFLNNQDWVDA